MDAGDFSIISSTLTLDAGENIVNGTRNFTFAQTVDDLMIENNFTLTISFNSSRFLRRAIGFLVPAKRIICLIIDVVQLIYVLDNGKSQLSSFS